MASTVSVVIPCYNSAETIGDVIRAVLPQNPHEVIVVDDGSTDGSAEVVKKFPVRLIQANRNYGVATARNTGARVATGDILLFIDSDVIVPRTAINDVSYNFIYSNWDAVIGMPTFYTAFDGICSKHFNWRIHFNYLQLPTQVHFTYGSFTAILADKFRKSGGYKEELKGAINEDNEFGLRASLRIKLDKTIRIIHLKHINFFGLMKNDFIRSAGRIQLWLKYRKGFPKTFISTPLSQVLSIPFAWLTFLNPLFFIGLLLCYRRYLWFLMKRGHGLDALKLIPIIFIDMLVVTFGILYGIWDN